MIHDSQQIVAWNWRDVGAIFVVVCVGMALITICLQVFIHFTGWIGELNLIAPPVYLSAVGFCSLIFLGVYLFAARRSGWAALGLCPAPAWTLMIIPVLVLVGFILVALVNTVIEWIQHSEFNNPQVNALTGGHPLPLQTLTVIIILVAGVVPVVEELFFRGMLYPLLRQRWSPIMAIMLNAAIFAGCHFIPLIFPALFVIGVLLACLREWSGSIIPCILYHGLQNGIALIIINYRDLLLSLVE